MKKKIVVAMSGGVDSSVAAALLKEEGYDVIGVTLKTRNWNDEEGRKFGGCCGASDFYDARAVAQTLDIPHYNFDYVEQFKTSVIGYFKDSYLAGETPNPCIACNQFVKFDRLLQHAKALGADYLATGHYARITESASAPERIGALKENQEDVSPAHRRPNARTRYALRKAVDGTKDQSYVLYHLGQSQLAHLRFPIGDYAKTEIRDIARKYQLATAEKPDSQEICFVPNNDYRSFLTEQVPAEARQPGPIQDIDGRTLGQHQGLPFYTIGQRSGLGLAVGHPLYVVSLKKESNTLVVGRKNDILVSEAVLRRVTWISGKPVALPAALSVKIRYKHTEAPAVLREQETERKGEPVKNGMDVSRPHPLTPSDVVMTFSEPQAAVTPGQAAVFYDGDEVLGGGVIDHVVRS